MSQTRLDLDRMTVPSEREYPSWGRYRGETYYGEPPIKSSYYRWLVAAYFFVGGLASACQFIATVADFFGGREERLVVRSGRYVALVGALMSPLFLIADLHTPRRWYNMLRIYRRTSPMSIGSWALVMFGMCSGVVAAGQALEDLAWKPGRWLARLSSLPAALAGGLVALYTGTLLAATNIPLWLSVFPYLSSLFASSSVSTATAALILAADLGGASAKVHRRMTRLSFFAGLAELCFALITRRHWARHGVAAPVLKPPVRPIWRYGVLGLGVVIPLVVHAAELGLGRVSRGASTVASITMLLGGFLLRAVFIVGGNESGRRPVDYFKLMQFPVEQPTRIVLRPFPQPEDMGSSK